MMNLQCSEVFPQQQWTKNLKIWLNHQIPYYHPLTYWLLGATIGKQGSQIDESSMFSSFPPPTMKKTPQNMAELLNSLLSPINLLVVRGNNWQPRMMNLQCSEVFPFQQWTKNLKIWLNHQILYYHPLTYWLLGATIGNQGSPMMNLQCSEVFPHQQSTKNLKIWLNHQILYYQTLTYWLLGATIG